MAAVLYVKNADAKRRLCRRVVEGAQAATLRRSRRHTPTLSLLDSFRHASAATSSLSSFCTDNEAPSHAPPPPRFARFASSSGPPPPLSRGRMREGILTTRSASEFYPWRGANWESPLRYPPPATCFFLPSKRRGGRTPTDAEPSAALTGAARAQRSAHACRRSTAALAAANQRRRSASGALPGTWLRNRCCLSPPVPVQRQSRRPVIVPAGRFPEAARERQ